MKAKRLPAAMSANAAAADLNGRGVTTAAGKAWRAEQVLRARRHLGLFATDPAYRLELAAADELDER